MDHPLDHREQHHQRHRHQQLGPARTGRHEAAGDRRRRPANAPISQGRGGARTRPRPRLAEGRAPVRRDAGLRTPPSRCSSASQALAALASISGLGLLMAVLPSRVSVGVSRADQDEQRFEASVAGRSRLVGGGARGVAVAGGDRRRSGRGSRRGCRPRPPSAGRAPRSPARRPAEAVEQQPEDDRVGRVDDRVPERQRGVLAGHRSRRRRPRAVDGVGAARRRRPRRRGSAASAATAGRDRRAGPRAMLRADVGVELAVAHQQPGEQVEPGVALEVAHRRRCRRGAPRPAGSGTSAGAPPGPRAGRPRAPRPADARWAARHRPRARRRPPRRAAGRRRRRAPACGRRGFRAMAARSRGVLVRWSSGQTSMWDRSDNEGPG